MKRSILGLVLLIVHTGYPIQTKTEKTIKMIGDTRTKVSQAMFHADQLQQQGKLEEARQLLVGQNLFLDRAISEGDSLIDAIEEELNKVDDLRAKIIDLHTDLDNKIKSINKEILTKITNDFLAETAELENLSNTLQLKLSGLQAQLRKLIEDIPTVSPKSSLKYLIKGTIPKLVKQAKGTSLEPLLNTLQQSFKQAAQWSF